MDNVNVQTEDFDIDSYLEKWNDENVDEDADVVEAPEETEENENEAAGTAKEFSEDGEKPLNTGDEDLEEDTSEDNAQDSKITDESHREENSPDAVAPEATSDAPEAEDTTAKESKEPSPYQERFNAALAEIQTEFPHVHSANEIGDIRTFAILTTVGKMSPLEAYKTIKGSTTTKENNEDANEESVVDEPRGTQKATGKSHLRSVAPKEIGEGKGLTDSEAEALAEDLGMTVKDVRNLYKRVTK